MLTKREQEIMNLLWNSGEAISCLDIIDKLDLSAGKNYIYALLRSLLKQGYIIVDDSKPYKVYPKVYRPTVTKSQYIINEFFGNQPDSNDIKQIIQCAVDKIDNINDLRAIEVYVVSHRINNSH